MSPDFRRFGRGSHNQLPTLADTIDELRKTIQDRGEIVILYFNFDRYTKVEEIYGWEKLDLILETTAAAMRETLLASRLSSIPGAPGSTLKRLAVSSKGCVEIRITG